MKQKYPENVTIVAISFMTTTVANQQTDKEAFAGDVWFVWYGAENTASMIYSIKTRTNFNRGKVEN